MNARAINIRDRSGAIVAVASMTDEGVSVETVGPGGLALDVAASLALGRLLLAYVIAPGRVQ